MKSKKIKIQIVSWLNGSVLFEYECVDNTVAKTVTKAISSSANLSSADLSSANLSSANLRSANLSSADLSSANLRSANLSSADLHSANLSSADLRSADLRYANLHSANLHSANLSSANLHSANLSSADLHSANLHSADLRSAKNSELAVAMTRILPQGTIAGYKKCAKGIIVKLQIPARAKRSHAFGRKCRAEYAKVMHIYGAAEAYSTNDPKFVYKVGAVVRPTTKFNEDWTNECSSGIHFFITKEEAEAYVC